MATMIPEKPRDFAPASQEGLIFDALCSLPDDYYVFHSFRITEVRKNVIHENETDFVILNKAKGVICLEAKAGHVRYEDGCWLYGSGIPMHNGGPFNQASSNKYKLMKYIENRGLGNLIERCKFFHAVWFPSVSDGMLKSMTLPSEADKTLILTKEALENPKPFLDRIYAVEFPGKAETKLTDAEFNRLVRSVFCPKFDVVPSVTLESDLKKLVFHRLLKEQAGILDFLDEQYTAAINGAAGTGKTMIALEKARRHAAKGEPVLFLCFNKKLEEFLVQNYADRYITFKTVDGLACSLCRTESSDYDKLGNLLLGYLDEEKGRVRFPYRHVIIDEGQDFGDDRSDILKLLCEIVTKDDDGGTFYVFYDCLQRVQARSMPEFIEDLECRLTLHKNCRNTENIAKTSMRPISKANPKLFEGAVKGTPAKLHFCKDTEDEKARIDSILDASETEGTKNTVILTCKTEETSILAEEVRQGKYRGKYHFTTCRKFKGLEADEILLIDVDRGALSPKNVLLFYVGASRARIKLEITAVLSDADCADILRNTIGYEGKIRTPKKDLAGALNTTGCLRN